MIELRDVKCSPGWRFLSGDGYKARFERTDFVYVMKSDDEYYARPWLPAHRGWVAFRGAKNKDEDGTIVGYDRRTTRFRIPRRWKTPEAAMRAMDREHPMRRT